MRRGIGKIALAAVMLAAFQLSAAKKLISSVDVDVVFSELPEIEFRKAVVPTVKNSSVNRWLMIKIEYTMDREVVKAPELRKERGKYYLKLDGFADDLKLRVRVLQDTGLKTSGKSIYGLYTGETAFYNVRLDGKKHQALMFVPGWFIDRYSRSPNGQVRTAAKNDFIVEAVFSSGGRDIAREYYGISGAKDFAGALSRVPENMVFSGGVLPRSRTPWAVLNADRFDVENEFPSDGY